MKLLSFATSEPKDEAAIPAILPETFRPTDVCNAERFVTRHGHNLRFCHAWKKWLMWDGRRWRIDNTGQVDRCAKETAMSIYEEDPDWAEKSESRARLTAMVELAKTELGIPVTPELLDADPWLLTCGNGTIDLRSGKLREHGREDLCTKIVRIGFDASATCPLFDSFLNRIMGDNAGLISFLQRAIGYSLTGSIKEQCVFIGYGLGQNGKTTLFETVRKLLGDYAKTADSSLLLIKNSNSIRNDVARLAGARFVSTSETEAGRTLAEALVKQLTGGDTITSRFLYREYFEFTSQFKIFLVTNHRPQVRGVDKAIWRRVRLIPFEVTIPDEELDKDLGEKLLGELPGILAWAVRGCLDWQEQGLGMPPEVSAATDAYRQQSDVLGAFIEDCCVRESDIKIPVGTLYYAYQHWCKQNVEEALKKREFGLQLSERGFKPYRDNRKRYRLGIGLAKHVTDDDAGDAS